MTKSSIFLFGPPPGPQLRKTQFPTAARSRAQTIVATESAGAEGADLHPVANGTEGMMDVRRCPPGRADGAFKVWIQTHLG